MTKAGEVVTVLTTVAGPQDAERLASVLLDARLIACANILPGATSLYRWKGEIQRDAEVLVLMKTTTHRLEALEERLLAEHPYDVPELLAVPVIDGSSAYLNWVAAEVQP